MILKNSAKDAFLNGKTYFCTEYSSVRWSDPQLRQIFRELLMKSFQMMIKIFPRTMEMAI